MSNVGRQSRRGRWRTAERVLAASLAVFGMTCSAAVFSVVVAGLLQWDTLPSIVRNVLPAVVLALGLVLTGRVAVDVAGRAGIAGTAGSALVVLVLGLALSRSTEAHGDGIEPHQVVVAALVVLAVTGGTAWWVSRRRERRGQRLAIAG
ncbi:MAG: hypothetical protein JOZ82_09515 [Marmoricola sp.]|nr:hypothetical protein [Marmoricola sp.]